MPPPSSEAADQIEVLLALRQKMAKGLSLGCRDLSSDSRVVVCETSSGYYIREMLIDESRVKAVNEMILMRQNFPFVSVRLGCFSFVLQGPL